MLFNSETKKIVEDNSSSTISSKRELNVSLKGNKISYDLMSIIPKDVDLKKTDLVLRGEDSSGNRRYITSNLRASSKSQTIENLDKYNNIELSTRVEYEQDGKIYSMKGTSRVVEGSTVSQLDVVEEVPAIQSEEDLIAYLLKEIGSLKNRVKILEGDN